MGLYTQLPDDLQEFDVIVVGGGTAGCVVASRLAESDCRLNVLVIEKGPSNIDNPSIRHLAYFWKNFSPPSKTMTFLVAGKSDHVAGRQIPVPTGRGLGGGSAVNMAIYSRAQRSDYNSWRMPNWSAQELLPFMRKLETYHGPGAKKLHGYDGPVPVSFGTYCADKSAADTLSALARAGWPEVEDLGNLDTGNGGQRALRYVSLDGTRSDAARSYLHPKLNDANLHVLVESSVVKVQLENGRATGVVYKPDSTSSDSAERTVKARKMIVIASGACGSPPILERSGIGDPSVLQKAGVKTLVNLPGVGHDYQDHHLIGVPYRSSLRPDESFDTASGIASHDIADHEMRGWNGVDVTFKLRPTESHVAALGPEFVKIWERDFKQILDRPMAVMAAFNGFPGDSTGLPPGQYFSHSIFTVYPFSRGHIHITGSGLNDGLDFDTGFFSDREGIDIKACVWAYKTQREVARRRSVYRGEVAQGHPPFLAGSDAICVKLEKPLADDVQDIQYTPEDDAIIAEWLRRNITTTWHSLGTCKMGSVEDLGVVDENLSVHSVKGLKVADLSIVPQNVGAHPNNTALTIGEKAADIFIKELKR